MVQSVVRPARIASILGVNVELEGADVPSTLKKCKHREKDDVTLLLKCAVMLELCLDSFLK